MEIVVTDDFLFIVNDIARKMRTQIDQRARTRRMTRAQWVILVRLEQQPGMSQTEMATRIEVEPITVARLIDRLEARGLIERRPDSRDRRIWRLQLTPAASPVLREIKEELRDFHEKMTAGIDPMALKMIGDSLHQMKANLGLHIRWGGKAR